METDKFKPVETPNQRPTVILRERGDRRICCSEISSRSFATLTMTAALFRPFLILSRRRIHAHFVAGTDELGHLNRDAILERCRLRRRGLRRRLHDWRGFDHRE